MHGKLDCHGLTNRGLVRETNQDQFLIADLKKSVIIHETSLSYDDETELLGGSQAKLFLVADGVGGHAGGDRASVLALESVMQYLLNAMHWVFLPEDEREATFMEDLKEAMAFSRSQIQHAAEAAPNLTKMGTTMTMAYVVWPTAYIVHAGDSRAYLHRDGRLTQLTQDQTYAQALADHGAIKPEEIQKSTLNHILFSLLGCDPDSFQPQTVKETLTWNDKLLLCTDGLNRHVNDEAIAKLLDYDEPSRALAERLVDQTLDAGGRDNVTVVVAKFGDSSQLRSDNVDHAAAVAVAD